MRASFGLYIKMRTVLEPITKVTLNLYTRDVKWFKEKYPEGYTERIREIVREQRIYEEMYEYERDK
jgi:hypothetical protein